MLLSQKDREKIAWLAEETDRIPDEGHWDETEAMLMHKLWKDFNELEARATALEREHEACVQRQASVGLYLQHIRASAAAASRGYLVGDEAQMLNAVAADLERAAIGHWPISKDEVESLVAEVEERDLPG